MPLKPKRVNKTKQQIQGEMAHLAKVNREKSLVKLMFPAIADIKTIYDAQTVLSALSGFIKTDMDRRAAALTVADLQLSLEKEEDSEIKSAITNLIGLLGPENARDTANLLERFGNILAQHSAHEFMKQPMSAITVDKIVSE